MHPLTFEVKRTHWRVTWEAIALFRAAGAVWKEPTLLEMTPARCDILQCVWDHESDKRAEREAAGERSGARQMPLAELHKKLGLAGTTVWKCVQTLVALEWVWLARDPVKKRRIIVVLTDLGIHALRMAQQCTVTDFVDEQRARRECIVGRIALFVARDAERQELVVPPEAPAAVTPSASTSELPPPFLPPTTWAAMRPTPRTRRSFGCWSDYLWWLVEHMRGFAQFFESRAGRLYFRQALGQVVSRDDDTWFDEDTPSGPDGTWVEDEPDDDMPCARRPPRPDEAVDGSALSR